MRRWSRWPASRGRTATTWCRAGTMSIRSTTTTPASTTTAIPCCARCSLAFALRSMPGPAGGRVEWSRRRATPFHVPRALRPTSWPTSAACDPSDRREGRRLRVARLDHPADVRGIEVERVERQRLGRLEEPDPHLPVLGPQLGQVVLETGDAQVRAAHLVVHDVDRAEQDLRDGVRILGVERGLGER